MFVLLLLVFLFLLLLIFILPLFLRLLLLLPSFHSFPFLIILRLTFQAVFVPRCAVTSEAVSDIR